MHLVFMLQATLTHTLATGDAEVSVGFPVVFPAVSYPCVVGRETTEKVFGRASFGERECGVQLGEVIHRVQLKALLAQER